MLRELYEQDATPNGNEMIGLKSFTERSTQGSNLSLHDVNRTVYYQQHYGRIHDDKKLIYLCWISVVTILQDNQCVCVRACVRVCVRVCVRGWVCG